MTRLLFITILFSFSLLLPLAGQMAAPGNSEVLDPRPLKSTVNSPYTELAPLVSPDGNTLYFTRLGHPQNMGDHNREDVWVAKLLPDGTWGRAVNMGGPLNNRYANSVIAVAPDGNTLYLFDNYRTGKNEGIARSVRKGRFWEKPNPLKIDDYYNLDTTSHFHLNAAGDVLLMALSRRDGYGNKDIYVSFQRADQSWTAPRNLGADLNTAGREAHVFLATDDKTLYFATDGRPGQGGLDIFMSRRLDDSWTSWSTPRNLGPAMNTAGDDRYFSLPAAGTPAYLVRTDSSGKRNIYRMPLSEAFRPDSVGLVGGEIEPASSQTGQIAPDILISTDLGRPEQQEKVTVTDNDSFRMVMPYGKNIGLQTEGGGYYAPDESPELSDETPKERDVDHLAGSVSAGALIPLRDILFQPNTDQFMPASYPELDRLRDFLMENPGLKVEIGGHTNGLLSHPLALELSTNRAGAVVAYLTANGITAGRLIARGYGNTLRVGDDDAEEGRKEDQRVEMRILEE